AGVQDAQYFVNLYPDTTLQLALWMVDELDQVNAGALDANIRRLGDWIKQAKRPVYLRIGYEFDYPGNRYDPAKYVQAFRRIVGIFREQGVDNVATVWHSFASKTDRPMSDWYPGDDVVDWVAVTYFHPDQGPYLDAVANF